jgi:hypothetical protein
LRIEQPYGPRRIRSTGVTTGRFHLDDVGAEVSEQHRRQRPRGARAAVEDAHAGERIVGHVWYL